MTIDRFTLRRIQYDVALPCSGASWHSERNGLVPTINPPPRSGGARLVEKGKVLTSLRATVKVTLGWQVVYELEVWIMSHHAGADLILDTYFMISTGIRLGLYNSTARLPDEVEIPLIKSRSAWLTEPTYGDRVSDRPAESLSIPAGMIAEFTLRRKQPSEDPMSSGCLRQRTGYQPWLIAHAYSDWQVLVYEAAMDKDLLKKEQRLYADWLARQPPAVERIQYAVPKDVVKRSPRRVDKGEAELTSAQQHELLERAAAAATESAIDRTEAVVMSTKATRDELHESETIESGADDSDRYEPAESGDITEWDDGPNAGAAHQPRRGVAILETESPDQASEREHPSQVDSARHETAALKEALRTARELSAELSADSRKGSSVREAIDSLLSDEIEVSDVALADDPEDDLRLRFVAAMATCEDESITAVDNSAADPAEFECSANEIDLEDYAYELAFLPDLTGSASTVLDFGGSNVVCSAHTLSQREKLVNVLKEQEGIIIASGNALPPPVYGAICDIDVQGHKPIKQRARRIPLKHLKKLYELLKGLLKAGLIAFSNSPWTSPIVIVLKKNRFDIRLCIDDYKMVNAITVLMEYAMSLVDDLLTELESYLWLCSLVASSGFWAVMMTQRARAISAFVCAWGTSSGSGCRSVLRTRR
ncbi:unnamed protein product [Phytophthora fragariaefolia]|uniref:Unnamed protein product n=1 Tax=Phytophthora fragariaefolia TaxID=1490495 RepID=A0A9W6UCS8_9STRA|nr:unnamed protein product [Phytophthora fragariaefolia]